MEHTKLRCQICHISCSHVYTFKSHVQSHSAKMKEIFPNESFTTSGLSHLTLVFGANLNNVFYMCHVCCIKFPLHCIINHITSEDHFTNYLSITDPNSLAFSWIPKKENSAANLRKDLMRRSGELQMLHLPDELLAELAPSLYSEVMRKLSENVKLFKLLQDALPTSDLIQSYQKDSRRENPLLGLQHIVECVNADLTNDRHYLCTLCQLTVAAHMIVKHVLSFDHVFRYFEERHPSTLLSKASYQESAPFTSLMRNLAKQAEQIQGCTEMKHVSLKPADFKSIDFKSYPEALKKLESIQKCSLETKIEPGTKLEYREAPSAPQPTHAVSAFHSFFKITCPVCNTTFTKIYSFRKHLEQKSHKEGVAKVFNHSTELDRSTETASFFLGIHSYILKCLSRNERAVGIPMVVSCVTTESKTEPSYVCFACDRCFPDRLIETHLTSQKHIMCMLDQYQDTDVLPFAWTSPMDLDLAALKAKVWEKEKPKTAAISLKVLDMPYSALRDIKKKPYSEAVEMLQNHNTALHQVVPRVKAKTKLHTKENFPLLGQQFLVTYDVHVNFCQQYKASLCLLCKRKLLDEESNVHVFSREHVTTFLDAFHPGSLKSSSVNADALLDLAQQAWSLHPVKLPQTVNLLNAINEIHGYQPTLKMLTSAKKRDRSKMVEPSITPRGPLFSSRSSPGDEADRSDTAKLCAQEAQNGDDKCVKQELSEEKPDLKKAISAAIAEVMKKVVEPLQVTTKEEPDQSDGPKVEQSNEEVPNNVNNAGALAKEEEAESAETVPAQQETCSDHTKNKRNISMCEKPREETGYKRRRLTCEGEKGVKKDNFDAAEEKKPDQGLPTLYICHYDKRDSVYLCECCSLKIPQEDLISHINGHPDIRLKDVNLDEDVYSIILNQNFESAIKAVLALGSCETEPERPSTSAVKDEAIHSAVHDQHHSIHIKAEDVKTTIEKSSAPLSENHSEAESTSNVKLDALRTETTLKIDEKVTVSSVASEPSPPRTAAAGEVTKVNAASKTAENTPKYHNTAPQTSGACQSLTKSAKKPTPVTKSGTPAEEKVNVSQCIQDNAQLAAPQVTPPTSVRPESRRPSKELPLAVAKKTEPIPGSVKIGDDQLIVLTCSKEKKRRVFCQLCSVKLESSDHLRSVDHQYNYVKMKLPGCTVNPWEDAQKFQETVAMLAKEQGNSSQRLEVPIDVYQEFSRFSVDKALQRLKEMLTKRSSEGSSSSSTANSPCEVTSTNDGVSVGENRGCVEPNVDDSESPSTHSKTPPTTSEIPANSQHQPAKDPELAIQNPDTQRTPEDAQKTSDATFWGLDPHVEPTTDGDKEAAGQSTASHGKPGADEHKARPRRESSSQELSTVSIGERIEGLSLLSTSVKLKKLIIIGQDTVWECQGTSQSSFFLCESCELMLLPSTICQHMTSQNHTLNYLRKYNSELIEFWTYDYLTEEEKLEILDLVVKELWPREKLVDAKIVLLGTELHQCLQRAPFSDAIKIMQSISEKKLRAAWPSACPPPQKKVEQKPKKAATAGGKSHDAPKRKASSPLDVTPFPSKTDSAVAPLPNAVHPKEMCASLPAQRQIAAPVSQHQLQTVPMLPTNQMEAETQSLSSTAVDPEVAQMLPPADLPSRKRPSDQSVEMLVRSCASSSAENSLPTAHTAPSRPSSVSAHPAVTPIPPPPELENTKSVSDQQKITPDNMTVLSKIISAFRNEPKENLSALLAPSKVEPANRCAVTSVPSDERKASLVSECIEKNTADGQAKISGEIPAGAGLNNHFVTQSAGFSNTAIKSHFENFYMKDPQVAAITNAAAAKPQPSDSSPIDTVVIGRGKYAYGHNSAVSLPAVATVNPTVNPHINSAANAVANPTLNPPIPSYTVHHPPVGFYQAQFSLGPNQLPPPTFGHSSAVGMQPMWEYQQYQQQQYYLQYQQQQYLNQQQNQYQQ
ncbi:unnamed protein product [Ophioblennius macclurei]